MVATSLVPSPAVAPLLIAVDSDGTITLRGTPHVIADECARTGGWHAIGPRAGAGRRAAGQAMGGPLRTAPVAPRAQVAA